MFTDPVKNLKAFGFRENSIVADLGAGSGFYSIPVAQMVPNGKVYAIEVQKDYLKTIANKAKEAHLPNIECILGNIEKIGGTKIKDSIVDAVIVSNVFFQIEDRENFIKEIKRILKPGGRVMLIDWADSSSGIGASFGKIISKSRARQFFEQEGFIWHQDIDAGEHHYGIILTKGNRIPLEIADA